MRRAALGPLLVPVLVPLLVLAACGDERLTTLRASGAAGTGGASGAAGMGGAPPPPPPPPGDCSTAMFGYATVEGGTKGGLGGETVKVTTWDELNAQLSRVEPVTIQISGMIANSGHAQVSPHKTIVGLGEESGLEGAGLTVLDGDVIVRNLVIRHARADAITVSSATHVWIDHCDLSSDQTHSEEYYDGLLDIVHGSDDVTVSWTHFHDHFLTSLVGHSNDNATQDTGHLRVTYHHNWFERTTRYNPTIRFGTLHAFNNYYLKVSALGISARMGAHALAEANYFDTVQTPLLTDEGDTPGFIVEKGANVYVNVGPNEVTQSADLTPPYPYAADPAAEVPELVMGCAGTGKITP